MTETVFKPDTSTQFRYIKWHSASPLSTLMSINLSSPSRDKRIGFVHSGRAIPSQDIQNDDVCTVKKKKKKRRKTIRGVKWFRVRTRRRHSPMLRFAFWSNNDDRGTRHAGHLSFAPLWSLISPGETRVKSQTSELKHILTTTKYFV